MRRLILVIIAIVAIAALIRFANLDILTSAFTSMPPSALLLVFAFFLAGAIVKSMRFAFYLKSANLDIRWRDGMTSYLAALSVAAVPGGGWLSARLAQEHGHVRMRQAASAMYVSLVADAIAISTLAYGILLFAREPAMRFIIPGIGVVVAILLVIMGRSERVWNLVSRLLAKKRVTSRFLPQGADVHSRILAVMRSRVIFGGVLFSFGATLLSAAMLWAMVNGLTIRGLSLFEGVTIMSLSQAAGVVIPVPAGLGVTDTSMAAQLNALAIGFLRATYIALAYRSIDLLFKTVFGTLVLAIFYNRLLMEILHVRRRARKAYRVALQAGRLSFSVPMGIARILWRLHAASAPLAVTYESRGVPQRHREKYGEQPPRVNPADFVDGFGIVAPVPRSETRNREGRSVVRHLD
jgi:putative heme transporter